MTFSGTVQQVIDSARSRHFAFADTQAGDGAALLYLNQRLRTHLAAHGAKIEGLVGTSMEYVLAVVNGVLIAEDPVTFVPQYTTTYEDGFPLHIDPITGVPYFDPTEAAIAQDPFGAHGGTPGFPLPAEMIRLISVFLIYNNNPGQVLPCTVVNERQRLNILPGRNPNAFVSGNRLVPCLPLQGAINNSADRWFSVTGIQISYVALTALSALTDRLNIPSVLLEALTADLACYFAYQAKALAQAERVGFAGEAQAAAKQIAAAAEDILESPTEETVDYRG